MKSIKKALLFGVGAFSGVTNVAASMPAATDDRPALVLPESTDLNRVLRKVNDFFAQEPPKWDDGVRMLQDLLEGRVLKEGGGPDHLNDPFYSVYSEDQRLYIPFARYCQRLICRLPPEGLEAYRFLCDRRARSAFEEAAARLDMDRLQRLAELYFATESGPEIVTLVADLAALKGDLARSVYLRDWLLQDYPDLDRDTTRELLVRQCHAFAMLGDRAARDGTLTQLRDRGPKENVRILGQPIRVETLAGHPAFRLRESDGGSDAATLGAAKGFTALQLRKLWSYRFKSPDPYLLKSRRNQSRRGVFFGGQRSWEMPHRRSARPGLVATPYMIDGRSRVVFKDHDKCIVLETLSGKLLAKSAGQDHYRPTANIWLYQRLPATDFGVQRVEFAGRRLYTTVDNKQPQANNPNEFPFRNRIVALDAVTGDELWKSEIPARKTHVFFQAPPIAYRGYLYAPVRRKRSFCIAQLDAKSGEILNQVTVHSGGTSLLRVAAVPPVRVGNQLILLTNAGAVAAFNLPSLELNWLRAHETRTPHQPLRRAARTTRRGYNYGVREVHLKKWKPTEAIVHKGRVIIAPTNSDALLCLDVHTGRPAWMLPREDSRRGVSFDEVVGHDGRRMFVAGDHLQAIDMTSGKRLWEVSLQHLPQGTREGHGTVAGDHVYLPFRGGIYRFRRADGRADGVISFPADKQGDANWGLPVRLQFAGSLLLAMTEAGILAYSVPGDLVAAAADGIDRARRLAVAGEAEAALDALAALIENGGVKASQRDVVAFFVRLTGEVAKARRRAKGVEYAVEVLDRSTRVLEAAGLPVDPRLILFRIECLDPSRDAREIRALRERLSDLSLRELQIEPAGSSEPRDDR